MLTARTMRHFRIEKAWRRAGHFDTKRTQELSAAILLMIKAGHLITVTGPVGIGKSTLIKALQDNPDPAKSVLFARSRAVEKPRVPLSSLMMALRLDIAGDPDLKVMAQGERQVRQLQAAIDGTGKPVALCVDDAHDLSPKTLMNLKRLAETTDRPGILSIILVGHPRLHNDLLNPTMEEIGHRTIRLTLESMSTADTEKSIEWLFAQCRAPGTTADAIIEPAAREFLAENLSTPLQVAEHLDRAFADADRTGAEKVTRNIVESTIAAGFEDPDARMARNGYSPQYRARPFDLPRAEMRRYLKGRLDGERTAEISDIVRRGGLSLESQPMWAEISR